MNRWTLSLLVLSLPVIPTLVGAEPGVEFFEKEIRPLLIEHCQDCHSTKKTKGGLKLTSRAEMLLGGDSGPSVVVGKAKESLLIQAIHYSGSSDLRMPPKGKLPETAITKLTKWVNEGAVWPDSGATPAAGPKSFQITPEQRQFWAFQPVSTPAIPKVENNTWAQSDLDRFILHKIEQAGLKPNAMADRRTLLRRVTFDLTGLPPTPEEIAAFLVDQAPNAFEKIVDRLLASPAYGERWGRHWLDVARYADSRDSRGVGNDIDILEAWHYRDWVIRAMNQDVPFNQFAKMQIAGDLLPPATPGDINADGITATGLLAIGEWGTGDADKEKMVTDVINDQVDIVTRSFLGLTVGCARCHDHKFDPISQTDYYALAGIFFSSKILPSPGPKTNGSPMLRTPLISAKEQAERTRISNQLKQLDATINQKQLAHATGIAKAELPKTADYLLTAWDYLQSSTTRLPPGTFATQRGLKVDAFSRWLEVLTPKSYQLLAKADRNSGGRNGFHTWTNKSDCPNALINTTNDELQILTFRLPPKSVCVHPGPKSGVAVVWESPVKATINVTGKVADRDGNCGDGITWNVVHQGQTISNGDIPNGGTATINTPALQKILVQPGDRLELQILPKGAYECDTTLVDLTIQDANSNKSWNLTQDILAHADQNPLVDQYGNANVWKLMDMADVKNLPPALLDASKVATLKTRTEAQTAITAFANKFNVIDATSPFYPRPGEALTDEIKALQKERATLVARPMPPVVNVLAVQEGGIPGSMFPGIQDVPVHIRGSYTRLEKDRVPRHVPEILRKPADQPIGSQTKGSGRLELANFITRDDNPLTARVIVNRVWGWHFGEGLVRTPSNFGQLGERPTHPELLDHLTSAFIRDGWSLKKLHKRIILSSVYQQTSDVSAAAKLRDADNRLLSRFNVRPLEAEALRDAMLHVSGRLDRTIGGISIPDSNTPRRTVYLRIIRSDKSNYLALFDAADPETPTEKRNSSIVAPQALYLLNHPFALAQATALADRIQKIPGDNTTKLVAAYELLYSRAPSADELKMTQQFLTKGTWPDLCKILLCANEFMYIR